MPRIHAGNNQHRGSSHSRRAVSSSSSSEDKQRSRSGAMAVTFADHIDIDDDFEDFSYGEVSPKEPSLADNTKQQQRRETKQQKFTLEDTSSEEEEELPETSYKSFSKSISTTRKIKSKQKKSTNVSVDPKRLTPTVSSPKITLSSIGKKESNLKPPPENKNNNASSKRGSSKKGPIGKPIKSASRGKKSNDENDVNDADQMEVKQKHRASRSRRKKGSANSKNHTSSANQQQNNSSKNDTKSNDDDMLESGASVMDVEDDNEGVDTTLDTTSINKGQSTRIQVLPLRAIAIDNRVLPTFTSDSTSRKSYFEILPDFLEGLIEMGVLQPQSSRRGSSRRGNENAVGTSIIASLVLGTKSSRIDGKKGIGARIEQSVVSHASFLPYTNTTSGEAAADNERSGWLSEFLTPINDGLESVVGNDSDVESGFGAVDSWRYFGDFVEAVEDKLSHAAVNCKQGSQPKHPCSVTIFTTDTAFLVESDSTSHAQGLKNFWKRISPAFQSNAISEVSIMIVGTMYDNVYDDPQVSSTDFHRSIQCINEIRRHINELSQSMQSSSEWVFDEWNGKPLVNLNLQYIEGTNISFQALSQRMVHESFHETYSNVLGRLSFDLPETIEGIMCSISLDLQYSTLPNSIDCNETLKLVTDMKRFSALSSSSVDVIQSIPLSSVDSSLIYGVPMSARAGIDDDVSRYNEMKMLVRQMWKYLSNNDIGLVLRVRFEDADVHDEACRYNREELFLLVCEQTVEKPGVLSNDSGYDRSEALSVTIAAKTKSSCHGMLFRYATKGQMLHFVNEGGIEGDENSAEELQYQDYIERSIEMLASTGLNPLLL